MVTPYLGLLALIVAERGVELLISRRNAAWAVAHGGIESGRGHFPFMALLHAAFLASAAGETLLLDRPFVPGLGWPMLGLVLAAQALRYWAIATLGRYWNVRVIVVPGHPAITGGPYRFLRHPNYLAVIVEVIALPLVHGAFLTAAIFGPLNACMLAVRIRCEERALAAHSDYTRRLGDKARLVPALPREMR